ncbi:MAG: trypsin-like peptidase domain-containing protein [Coriobacteriia bacterium]|nr:trypsin-like peptidase domain-containing protein [Coriobacteriia bacterium]
MDTMESLQPQQQPKRGLHTGRIIAFVLVAALLGGIVGAGTMAFLIPRTETALFDSDEPLVRDTDTELSVNVARIALPSVVSLTTDVGGTGSGVIIDADGYILTNNHVIDGARAIEVVAGSNTYDATIVGTDPSTDIAVLHIGVTGLPAIEAGSSANLEVGQYVMALGSPFGLEKSASVGIISGIGQSKTFWNDEGIAGYLNLIQTDAAINPGNSGGALVDAEARLIGINTLITTTSGSSAGVGFAIPIDTALDIAKQLMEEGRVTHPYLGAMTHTFTAAMAAFFELPFEAGAHIIDVTQDSPAYEAGLRPGDTIVKIDGKDIASNEDVFIAIRLHSPGDVVEVTYYRGDERVTTEVELGSN